MKNISDIISTIECDVDKMTVTPEGVENYQWLYSNDERTQFATDLTYAYTTLIRERKVPEPEDIVPYKILGVRFLVEMVAVFQGDVLRERAKQKNIKLNVADYWHYWSKLFNEQSPPEPALLKILKRESISSHKSLFQPLRFFQKVLKYFSLKKNDNALGCLKIRPMTEKTLRDCIITTQRTSLILRHAEEVDKDVVFCNSERWFKEISDEGLKNSIKQNDLSLEKDIITMLRNAYRQYGIELKQHSLDYIQNIITKGAAMARVHYNRLKNDQKSLPSDIWTGTSNQFWDAMLRLAVKKAGGKTTGHDHGSGWSYITHPMRGINELWGCDYFMTFNDFHASEMKRMAPDWPLYEDGIPDIVGLKNINPPTIRSYPKFEGRDKKGKKTAFLMSNPYDNDMGRIGPGVPNNYLIDLQARMITILKEAGYDVVLKMHPESPEPPPEAYQEMGVKISWGSFTQMIEEADITIFKCIYTTAFTDALATNLPVMVFDNFGLPWTETGKALIEKRCGIYQAEYKGCRAVVEKDEFLAALDQAITRSNNHEFYTKYFL